MTVGSVNSGISGIQLRSGSETRRAGSAGLQGELIQALRAKQAFENTKKLSRNEEILKNGFSEEDVKLSISSQDIKIKNTPEEPKEEDFMEKNGKYLGEIKEFANRHNFNEIEEEDIKHALRYGTSILADYTA
jgi:hypothetical protein